MNKSNEFVKNFLTICFIVTTLNASFPISYQAQNKYEYQEI